MNKQPDQLLHDELFKRSVGLEFDTYEFLPPDGTTYPFVVMGDTHLIPQPTKSYLIGRVSSTVHVWGTSLDRKLISDMIGTLMAEFSRIRQIGNLNWSMDLASSSRIVKDNSTSEMLYHGILDLEFRFN